MTPNWGGYSSPPILTSTPSSRSQVLDEGLFDLTWRLSRALSHASYVASRVSQIQGQCYVRRFPEHCCE